MLDEIINYVQSLQQQVEFLSMKPATVNPELNIDIDRLVFKDIIHSRGSSSNPCFGFRPYPHLHESLPATTPMHPIHPQGEQLRSVSFQTAHWQLLETVVKNCGDFVHMHVAERNLLNDMVKIVKNKPHFHVKEKILILIDTWQEAFGGARERCPQYYAAYHELLRLEAVFPQKSERSTPVFTPPQTQPLSSYAENTRNIENGNEATASSVEAEFPTLALTEMQNARGIMDVLSKMLTAIDP